RRDLLVCLEYAPANVLAVQAKGSQTAFETVDNPVFLDAAADVFVAFGLVIAIDVSLPFGNELDHQRRNVCPVGKSTQASPNHTIRNAPVRAGSNGVLGQRCVDYRAFRMFFLMISQPASKLVIWIALILKRRWRHDEDAVDQFVSVSLLELRAIK